MPRGVPAVRSTTTNTAPTANRPAAMKRIAFLLLMTARRVTGGMNSRGVRPRMAV